MEVESVLVTGANRGIGLEFVKQFICLQKPPKYVFATYRNKDTLKALQEVKDTSRTCQVVLIQMDLTKLEDLKTARKIIEDTVKDNGLTLLINNAGVLKRIDFADITEEDMLFHFTNNTIGPVMVVKEMLPLLKKAASSKGTEMSVSRAAAINISALLGSIEGMTGEHPWDELPAMGYRMSKSASNMAMRVVSLKVKDQGILVVNMCPGWVRTDMGTDKGELSPEESISCMLKTLAKLNESHHGTFMDRNGNTIPF